MTAPSPARVAAIVLAGGRSRRFGSDKLATVVGGRPLLDSAISAAMSVAGAVVVVGPLERSLPPGVLVTREEPAYAGPFAAVAAGLDLVDADLVLIIAGDLLDPGGALPVLLTVLDQQPTADAAVLIDTGGRRQPLLTACRAVSLRGCVAGVDPVGRAASELLDGLHVIEVPDIGGWSRDVDSPADLPG